MELTTWNLPVLALRGLTVFPHMSLTFDVERQISIAALERAMEGDQDIFLVTQREIGVNAPEEKDLYTIGTVSHITQILRLGQTSVRVWWRGASGPTCAACGRRSPSSRPMWRPSPEEPSSEAMRKSPRTEALLRQTYALFSEYAEQASGVPEEVVATVMDSRDPGFLADYIAQNIALRYTDKQEILEEFSPFARLRKLNGFLARENNVLGFEHEMESKVRDQLVRTQREQILRTQIRVLQNELGETDDGDDDEIEAYRQEILALELPEETEQHLLKEVNKLAKQPFGSAEGAVIRNYLDVCLEMPWNTTTKERVSVDAARKVLEKDHFGLEKVKERILETIAVRQMNPDVKGQILCLVGPPGVGKTSIAISVAKALNRKLARLSLGGVRDEADIRGHRKTYIGSMPGRIIEAISRSGSMNPLLLLDEIDKLGNDYRGDPASALLEVLDSEQNSAFRDHFLEIPVDLTQGDVHHHRQHHRDHPPAPAGPDGGDPALQLHRRGEAADRQAPPVPQAAGGARPEEGQRPHERRRVPGRHPGLHPGVRCPPAGAAAGCHLPQGGYAPAGGNCQADHRYRGGPAQAPGLPALSPVPSTRTGRRSAW